MSTTRTPASVFESTTRSFAATAAAIPAVYKNCTALNTKYPHGIGRAKARDRTNAADPITTFKRSTKLYNTAISFNSRLDGDKDGIACESD